MPVRWRNIRTGLHQSWGDMPACKFYSIVQMIKSYHSKYASLIKNYKRKMNDPRYIGNIQDFVNSSHALFDVCTCKCQDISKCTCEKNRKVPKNEENFLLDQRSERLLVIGRVDKAETNNWTTSDTKYFYWAVNNSYQQSWNHRNGYQETSMSHTSCRKMHQACHRISK